jgi:tripartite-type tricarboxylate transporter receptor subunit TctC
MKFLSVLLWILSFNVFSQPIEVVTVSGVGGPNDLLTRYITNHIRNNTNLNLIVINKPGAQHNIAYKYFSECRRECVLVASESIIGNKNDEAYPKGVLNIAIPLHYIGETYLVIMTQKTIRSVSDFSKSNPVYVGTSGKGTINYDGMLALCGMIPNCIDVPYKQIADMMRDLTSGIIDAFASPSYGIPLLAGSNIVHRMMDIDTKDKFWIVLFSNNKLAIDVRNKIENAMVKMPDDFYDKFYMKKRSLDINKFWKDKK